MREPAFHKYRIRPVYMHESLADRKILRSTAYKFARTLVRHWTERSHFSTESAGRSAERSESEVGIPREKTPIKSAYFDTTPPLPPSPDPPSILHTTPVRAAWPVSVRERSSWVQRVLGLRFIKQHRGAVDGPGKNSTAARSLMPSVCPIGS